MSYNACDFGLVVIQRLLICVSIILGYDVIYAPRDIPHAFILHALARIIRNFFYITKGIRKWLAIHYNDGIVPDPPMHYGRSSRMTRSTPRNSCLSSGFSGDSLKHSPIERRYSEPANNFDLATAFKEQQSQSDGMAPRYRYPDFSNSSDFFGSHHSSLSFRFLMNGLAQSFIGYIDDPDEEINKREVAIKSISQEGRREKFIAGGNKEGDTGGESLSTTQQVLSVENRRRAMEVVESVLEHDEEQRKANSSDGSHEIDPLPVPIFDADTEQTPTISNMARKKRVSCVTEVKGMACSHKF